MSQKDSLINPSVGSTIKQTSTAYDETYIRAMDYLEVL